MPEYRIEISPNNRAGCKDTVCKKAAVKILKGEIRCGTWVEIQEHGSWHWRHWGCVSGHMVGSMQELCDEDGTGDYDFDALDGFDEIPDQAVKDTIMRVVKQGHIDPEDFKGDPEKNKPGEKGIHLTAKQKELKEREAAEAEQESNSDPAPKKKKKTAAKRGRKADDDEADAPKAKKPKTGKKSKTEEEPAVKKVPRSRKSASAVKEESDAEPEEEAEPVPVKKAARKSNSATKSGSTKKKAAVKDEDASEIGSEGEDDEPVKPKKKAAAKAKKADEVPQQTSRTGRGRPKKA